VCTISTASSKNVQGVSFSTASSVDDWTCRVYPFPPPADGCLGQGVYQPTACSVDVQGVCTSSHLMPDCPASGQSGTGMNKNANPGTTAWPKLNLFLSISSLPFLFAELSPLSDTSSASASCFILLYYLISPCLGLGLSLLHFEMYTFSQGSSNFILFYLLFYFYY
jgi:hypothetical protein